MARTLVLLRHGESEWNLGNLFTGWYDCDLTGTGEAQAVAGGRLMAERGLLPDVVHTSVLVRAIRTAARFSFPQVKQWAKSAQPRTRPAGDSRRPDNCRPSVPGNSNESVISTTLQA